MPRHSVRLRMIITEEDMVCHKTIQRLMNCSYRESGELGCAEGYNMLAEQHYVGRGVDVDKEKGKHFYELAAMGGDVYARHTLLV